MSVTSRALLQTWGASRELAAQRADFIPVELCFALQQGQELVLQLVLL